VISNRALYLLAIEHWYKASALAPLQGGATRSSIGYVNAVKYYDRAFPTMAEGFGEILRRVSAPTLKAAMVKLASESGTNYPHRDAFFQAVGESVGSPGAGAILSRAGSEIVSDIGAGLKFGGKTVLIIGAVGLMLYGLMISGAPGRAMARVK